MAENNDNYVVYFQPGQIVFHVRGDSAQWDLIEGKLIGMLAPLAKIRAIFWPKKMVTKLVNNQSNAVFSRLKMVEFGKAPNDPSPGKPIKPLTSASYGIDLGKSVNPLQLIKLIKFLDAFRFVANIVFILTRLRAKLETVSPNWLMSGGSHPGATGGPGNRPSPFIKKSAGTSGGPVDLADPTVWEDTRDPQGQHEFNPPIQNQKPGENVIVAVFDTVPPYSVDTIYQAWATIGKDHPLIRVLCSPVPLSSGNKRLTIHPNPDLDIPSPYIQTFNPIMQKLDPPPGLLQPINHEYVMTDHGLFVSGIIHSLASQAEIHLYQVLNPYGVGDMLSVIHMLKKFSTDFALSDHPKVVNLSLEFNMPLEAGHVAPTDSAWLGQQILRYKPWRIISQICDKLYLYLKWDIRPWFDRQIQPLSDICDDMDRQGIPIIAAAGNDRREGQPYARYPAALDSVLGVGALPKFDLNSAIPLTSASYSNLSDRPQEVGITALGGEAGDQGVLGIYIGDFPPNAIIGTTGTTPSQNGWAWWSGTSFATPIVSGMIARELSGQSSFANRTGIFTNRAKEVINQILPRTAGSQGQLKTINQEDVLGLIQG